ncbi:MAG: hypothetical protein EOM88_01285 [Clostridia bacterium]|nr:hypothetical protein [Clostridia bacterium]
MKEFSKRTALKGKDLYTHFKREVAQFDLPVGSACFLQYGEKIESQLAFIVDRYSLEISKDFSHQNNFVFLKFKNFVSYDAKEIVDYLEEEWLQ